LARMAELYPDIEEAKNAHKALRDLFRNHHGGCADGEALYKAERLCFSARHAVNDAYLREKIGTVEEYASIIFSARKHQRWDRGPVTGAEFLGIQILKALDSYDKQLGTIEAVHRAGGWEAYQRSLESPS
jgi:hypothetical protein